MAPRRSHRKSRAGCLRCKSRKVKCDETRPRCRNCDKHGVRCDFENPDVAVELAAFAPRTPASAASRLGGHASTAAPLSTRISPSRRTSSSPTASFSSSSSSPSSRALPLGPPRSPSAVSALSTTTPSTPGGRLLELRLLHHFTTVTCQTLSTTNEHVSTVWRDFVPRTAFAAACGASASTPASSHLTDSILAIAALHLRSLAPHDRELVNASHAYMASSLSEYNRLLRRGITADNAVALFLNAALIAFQSTAARIFHKEEPVDPDVLSGVQSLPCVPSTDAIDPSLLDGPSASLAKTASFSPSPSSPQQALATLPPARSTPRSSSSSSSGTYGLPLSWFHAFQGVKTVTAASWQWLRGSDIVLPIINAQPPLHLDIASAHEGFFGHLLDDLDEELAGLAAGRDEVEFFAVPSPSPSSQPTFPSSFPSGFHAHTPDDKPVLSNASPTAPTTTAAAASPASPASAPSPSRQSAFPPSALEDQDVVARTRHAYLHAVAVLNWAHSSPYNGACLVFPATVSRHFVDLLGSTPGSPLGHPRRPYRSHRAVTILACFFAMLKTLDRVWWLQGMARREVLGVVSLFNADAVPMQVERRWWPHLQWAVRVALYHDDSMPSDYVPPDIWGFSPLLESAMAAAAAGTDEASVLDDLAALTAQTPGASVASIASGSDSLGSLMAAPSPPDSFVNHIDIISESINSGGLSSEFNYPSMS